MRRSLSLCDFRSLPRRQRFHPRPPDGITWRLEVNLHTEYEDRLRFGGWRKCLFFGGFPKDNRVGFFMKYVPGRKFPSPTFIIFPSTIGVFRFPFVSCFGLSAFIHTGGRAGLGWVSLTRALLLCRHDTCLAMPFPLRFIPLPGKRVTTVLSMNGKRKKLDMIGWPKI